MRFYQEPPAFQPVVITLETLAEVEALNEVVCFYMDSSRAALNDSAKEMAHSIKCHMEEVLDDE